MTKAQDLFNTVKVAASFNNKIYEHANGYAKVAAKMCADCPCAKLTEKKAQEAVNSGVSGTLDSDYFDSGYVQQKLGEELSKWKLSDSGITVLPLPTAKLTEKSASGLHPNHTAGMTPEQVDQRRQHLKAMAEAWYMADKQKTPKAKAKYQEAIEASRASAKLTEKVAVSGELAGKALINRAAKLEKLQGLVGPAVSEPAIKRTMQQDSNIYNMFANKYRKSADKIRATGRVSGAEVDTLGAINKNIGQYDNARQEARKLYR